MAGESVRTAVAVKVSYILLFVADLFHKNFW